MDTLGVRVAAFQLSWRSSGVQSAFELPTYRAIYGYFTAHAGATAVNIALPSTSRAKSERLPTVTN